MPPSPILSPCESKYSMVRCMLLLVTITQKKKYDSHKWFFTTRPPAVTDVFESGRNVGALRQARRVGFRCLAPGGQTTFPGNILFL